MRRAAPIASALIVLLYSPACDININGPDDGADDRGGDTGDDDDDDDGDRGGDDDGRGDGGDDDGLDDGDDSNAENGADDEGDDDDDDDDDAGDDDDDDDTADDDDDDDDAADGDDDDDDDAETGAGSDGGLDGAGLDCDAPVTCLDCFQCEQMPGETCLDITHACALDPACNGALECFDECPDDIEGKTLADCFYGCIEANPGSSRLFGEWFECLSYECYIPCDL